MKLCQYFDAASLQLKHRRLTGMFWTNRTERVKLL